MSAPTISGLPAQPDDRLCIPPWVHDLDSFRRWAYSDDYPRSGWVSFLDDEISVDLSMEEFSHNQVKGAFSFAVWGILNVHPVGRFMMDRMLLTNIQANLSTEPDGLFYLMSTMQSGRLRLVPGKKRGYTELEGTPDMVLEILSDSSERKDMVLLRQLYWKANVPEYWLVDVRGDTTRFDVLRHTSDGYVETVAVDGWLPSTVLQHQFQLVRQADALGHPQFVVGVRPA